MIGLNVFNFFSDRKKSTVRISHWRKEMGKAQWETKEMGGRAFRSVLRFIQRRSKRYLRMLFCVGQWKQFSKRDGIVWCSRARERKVELFTLCSLARSWLVISSELFLLIREVTANIADEVRAPILLSLPLSSCSKRMWVSVNWSNWFQNVVRRWISEQKWGGGGRQIFFGKIMYQLEKEPKPMWVVRFVTCEIETLYERYRSIHSCQFYPMGSMQLRNRIASFAEWKLRSPYFCYRMVKQ